MVFTIVEQMLGLKIMTPSVSRMDTVYSSNESSNEKSSDSLENDELATLDSAICSLNKNNDKSRKNRNHTKIYCGK